MSEADPNVLLDRHEFTIVRQVAAGGMGAVYEAEQIGADGFKKTMAVKTILTPFATDTEFVEMFIGEAKLVANLIHPNIVQLYHLGRSETMHYMSMEFVDGITLYDFMNRHRRAGLPIPAEVVAFMGSRVCRALDYAHSKTDTGGRKLGVVHRDVTPKNIMIDRRGVVKLSDFGVAKAEQYLRNKEGEVLVGKLAYMSPEQAAFGQTDGRTDLFSLAIVMWEALTNKNLFEEGETERALKAIATQKIAPPSRYVPMPPDLEDIIMKALERKLERRWSSAAAMGTALEKYLYHDRFGMTDDTMRKYLFRIARDIYPANSNANASV